MNKGVAFALGTALVSGVSIFVNKFGVAGINPGLFAFMKNLVVGIFLFSVIVLFRKLDELRRLSREDWMKLLLIGLVGGSVPFVLFFMGLKLASAASAAFIHKSMFVWVAVLAAVFLKEKLSKAYIAGAALLLAANFILLSINSFTIGTGEILILAATLMWSVEIAISKHALKHMSSEVVAFGRMFFGSLFILAYLIPTGGLAMISGAQAGWVAVTSLLLFGYVFTFYRALKLEKASIVTPVLLLGSLITFALDQFFAVFTAPMAIAASQMVGFALLLAGLCLTLKDYAFSVAKKKWM